MSCCRRFVLLGVDGMMTYLTRVFLERKVMPNLARLVRRGFARHAWPSPPMDTPTNWTTIATGAYTGTHGATSFYVHLPGEDFSVSQRTRFRTGTAKCAQAEFIWEVADEAGIASLVVNYPGGWGCELERGLQVSGWWPTPEVPPIRLAPRQRVAVSRQGAQVPLAGLGNRPSPGSLFARAVNAGVRVGADEAGTAIVRFGEEGWVELPPCEASLGHPVMVAVKARRRGKAAELEVLGAFSGGGWTIPDGLAPELLVNVEGFIRSPLSPKTARMGYEMFGDEGRFIDSERVQGRLLVDLMRYCMEEHDCRLVYSHWHLLDAVNHRYLGMLWPEHPEHTPDAEAHAWEVYEEAYRTVDQYVGWAMRALVDEETAVCVVSDHAALPTWKYVRVTRALVEAGLLAYTWDAEKGCYVVDWERTKAFPFSEPAYVWVNLEGREARGVVSEDEYEDVRDAIIEALWSITDPDTGEPVMRAVVRKEAVGPICGNGERVGDVVYFPRGGYGLYDGQLSDLYHDEVSAEDMAAPQVRPARTVWGYHAGAWPTEQIGPFQDGAVLIMAGAGIAATGWMDKPARLVDVAPTAARLLGLRRPAQAEGRVLHECLQ